MALSMGRKSAFLMPWCMPLPLSHTLAGCSDILQQDGLLVPLRQVRPTTTSLVQPSTTDTPSLRSKLALIFKATRQHARNLALFAFLYKALMLTLRHTPRPGSSQSGSVASSSLSSPSATFSKEAGYDSFLAGLVGGYIVFGRGMQSSVNQQIVIYVFARVVLGLAKMAVQETGVVRGGWRAGVRGGAWPVFAAVSWGAVMWLFRWRPETLQPSLRSSMKYM